AGELDAHLGRLAAAPSGEDDDERTCQCHGTHHQLPPQRLMTVSVPQSWNIELSCPDAPMLRPTATAAPASATPLMTPSAIQSLRCVVGRACDAVVPGVRPMRAGEPSPLDATGAGDADAGGCTSPAAAFSTGKSAAVADTIASCASRPRAIRVGSLHL